MNKFKFLIFILILSSRSFGQDLEKLNKKDLLKGKGIWLNGGVNLNNRYYLPIGTESRIPTFQLVALGRLQLDILGVIKMPITFSYTNRNSNIITSLGRALPSLPLTQPFNRLSLKPRYKGHILHLGTTALNFSPFTLSSYRVQGIGYEFNSSKVPIYGGLNYGTFKQAVPLIAGVPSYVNRPSYKRQGVAAKIGYKVKEDFWEFSVINAADLKKSLTLLLDSSNVFAEKNLAIATRFNKTFYKKILLSAEFGRSSIENIDAVIKRNLFKENLSLKSNDITKNALKTAINYKAAKGLVGFEYTRIDPGYKTFGVYFFNDDIETFSLKSSSQFLDGKLMINDALGYQKNHKKSLKPQAMNRYVGSFDINYNPTEKINLSANYSNFLDYTNLNNSFKYLTGIDPFAQLDTLNYRQINQNIGLNAVFQIPSKADFKKSIVSSINFQKGNSAQGNASNETNILNGNINGVIANENQFLNLSIGLNILKSSIPHTSDFMYGPIFNASKSFFKNKLKLTGALNYNITNNNSELTNQKIAKNLMVGNLGIQGTIKKDHSLNFTCLFFNSLNQTDRTNPNDNIKELTFNIGYNYNFKGIGYKFK